MDAVGGELNAFTANKHTCYYADVLDSDLELAVDLVADVVLNGRCAVKDVELERDVVLEEIAMRDDDPRTRWKTCSLRRCSEPPGGSSGDRLRQIGGGHDSAATASFHVRRYTPKCMVVAAAGNVDHDQAVALVPPHFGPHLVRGRRPIAPRKGVGGVSGSPGLALGNRDAEQTHCRWGCVRPAVAGSTAGRCRYCTPRWVPAGALGFSRRSASRAGGLLGLLHGGHLRRQRRAVGVRGRPAQRFAEVMRVTSQVLDRWHAKASPKPSVVSPRARYVAGLSGPGGFQLADEPDRSQRTELR